MTLLRRFAKSRLAKTAAVIVVLAVAWQVYLSIAAPGKIDPKVAAEVEQGEPLRLTVELGFPPERFHTLFLQDYGRVIGVHGDTVQLRSVRPSSVDALARVYWIDRILPGADR